MSVMNKQNSNMLAQVSTFKEQCQALTNKLENVENDRKLIANKLNMAEQQIEALKLEITKMNEDSKANLNAGFKQFISKLLFSI